MTVSPLLTEHKKNFSLVNQRIGDPRPSVVRIHANHAKEYQQVWKKGKGSASEGHS